MKKAEDGLPVTERTNKGLGVRIDSGSGTVDIDLDADGNVVLNGKGMSVAPDWRKLPAFLIPERLQSKLAKARGDDNIFCFTMGEGPFQDGLIAERLILLKDKSHHGCVVPASSMHLSDYETSLQQTRPLWTIDED